MEREEVKLHSAQLIFPNMPCSRLSFLLLLCSCSSLSTPPPLSVFCPALWVMLSYREVTAFSPPVSQKKEVIRGELRRGVHFKDAALRGVEKARTRTRTRFHEHFWKLPGRAVCVNANVTFCFPTQALASQSPGIMSG